MSPRRAVHGVAGLEVLKERLLVRRAELGRLRDDPLSDYEWEHLKWKYADRLGDADVAELLDDLDAIPAAPNHPPRRRPVEQPSTKDAGHTRSGALAALMALQASQRDDVQEWRHRALPDGLLPYDDALTEWLQARAEATKGRKTREDGRDIVFHMVTIPYSTPSVTTHVQRTLAGRGGLLDDLRIVADALTQTYRWAPDAAVVFVLTGMTPLVPSLRTTVTRSSVPSANCITLEIDPWVDPRRVAEAYQQVRSEAAEGRHFRLPEQRALALVEFVALHYGGEPTEPARKAWNAAMTKRKQSEWKYDDHRKFQRTYRDAVAKVLDSKLF